MWSTEGGLKPATSFADCERDVDSCLPRMYTPAAWTTDVGRMDHARSPSVHQSVSPSVR
jgi:hypothetical protein